MTEDLCGHSFSAAAVPSVVKRIDAPAAFSDRRLEEPFLYLIPGARYEKSRENGIVRPRALRPDDENCADSFTSIRDRRLVMLALYRRVSLDRTSCRDLTGFLRAGKDTMLFSLDFLGVRPGRRAFSACH